MECYPVRTHPVSGFLPSFQSGRDLTCLKSVIGEIIKRNASYELEYCLGFHTVACLIPWKSLEGALIVYVSITVNWNAGRHALIFSSFGNDGKSCMISVHLFHLNLKCQREFMLWLQ